MKLKFDSALPHQTAAVDAVVDLFDGQGQGQSGFSVSSTVPGGATLTTQGVGNDVSLSDARLLANTRAIQERNGIEKTAELQGRDFSIEMETGTGKTYVYLRSIFALNKRYGFKKFIVVVPSVAIREGVLKSIEMMRAHFQALYDRVPFNHFVYDSNRLVTVRQFSDSNHIQIMVINIQAFQKDVGDGAPEAESLDEAALKKLNVIYRDNDRMGGKPIEFIQAARPIVIIDEPQSVDTTVKSRRAIAQLNPALTLRYSATHRNPYNLLYRLGPIEAYDQRLVKRIEVASIRADEDYSGAYVKLLETDNTKGIRARLEIHKNGPAGPKAAKVWVSKGKDLYQLSGEHFPYAQGFVVENIDTTPGYETVEFNQGRFLEPGQDIGGGAQDVMKAMVRETVEQHLRKERALQGRGVKVLTLFFIDKVANYRVYNPDGSTGLGRIGQWFEEAYRELSEQPMFKDLLPFAVEQLHNGYFSQDKKGQSRDTRGTTQADEDTYALIMRDKERLLDPDEPLRFIFSHTALREGWDNPNVFQICTLREVGSELERRQQIGRGLRLPVNRHGERVHDDHLNRLTVIAGERYEDFAAALQSEYEKDLGIVFGRIERHGFARLLRRAEDGGETTIGQEESERIWQDLRAQGYLDDKGYILDRFAPDRLDFRLQTAPEFAELRPAIVDQMRGYLLKTRVSNAHKKRSLTFNKRVHLREDFRELWERIGQKTSYRVAFDTNDLIEKAANRLKAMEPVHRLQMSATKADVALTLAGVGTTATTVPIQRKRIAPDGVPDILSYLQKETELTRSTLTAILRDSGRIGDFRDNPQHFMALAAREIRYALHALMLDGLRYEKRDGEVWEMQRIENEADKKIKYYLNRLYEVRNRDKSLYDAIEFESEVEKRFAAELDNNEHVKFFVKLPRWFKIDTPIGPYNPDWAFVTEREERLYFVRETKSTLDSEERRAKENQKIECGRRHFDALGTDFGVVTSLSEVEM